MNRTGREQRAAAIVMHGPRISMAVAISSQGGAAHLPRQRVGGHEAADEDCRRGRQGVCSRQYAFRR